MGRHLDAPRDSAIRFNESDVDDMRRFQQAVADLVYRFQKQEREPLPAGVIAFGLANLCADVLEAYPANFRKKVIREINTRIFDQPVVKEKGMIVLPEAGSGRIRLH